jgi:hypothetical protein
MSVDSDQIFPFPQDDRHHPSFPEWVEAIATDDVEIGDAASGWTLIGPDAFRLWLASSVRDLTAEDGEPPLRFTEITEFRDGLIARMRALPDTATFLSEIGLSSDPSGDSSP